MTKKIGIDAMGGDRGSAIVRSAVKRFADETSLELVVYGAETELSDLDGLPRVSVVPTTQVIDMHDGVMAVRRKKDASMIRAIDDLKAGTLDGVVSCGSTGALLAASALIIKTIEGVDRPALLGVFPNQSGKGVIVLDLGANAENTPKHLNDFALIATVYAKYVRGIEQPKTALLNIGSEDSKGDAMHKETYTLLNSDNRIHFVGNIESSRIFVEDVDVVVTDGFNGNIALKMCEGTVSFVKDILKSALTENFKSKLGAFLLRASLEKHIRTMDHRSYGGALLAGLNAPVVKAHGSSDEQAFYMALKQLESIVEKDMVGIIKTSVSDALKGK